MASNPTEGKIIESLFPGVYRIPDPRNTTKRVLSTINLTPGRSFYGERLVRLGFDESNAEFRLWDPYRSKLAAAIVNRLDVFPFREGSTCLYLGASTGTTVSHISDIVGHKARVFGVEVAPRVAREFLENVVKYRKNIIPLITDARHPERYQSIYGEISVVYSDIAQPDQTEIAISNFTYFIPREQNAMLFLVVKASSIDVLKSKNEVFSDQRDILEKSAFRIVKIIDLEPFDRNHAIIVAERGS